MASKKDRIVIDTNLWISFLLSKTSSDLDKLLRQENIMLLFSEELLEEFIEVASRPKFKKYFSAADLEQLILQIRGRGQFIEVTSMIELCRDPKDNFLLSLCKDGNATHLITGDKDLLDLIKIARTKITTMKLYLSNY